VDQSAREEIAEALRRAYTTKKPVEPPTRHHQDASSGGVVLGSTPFALTGNDLRLTGCNLYRNGVLAGTGAGGAVLGSPLTSLVWLANTVGARGVGLLAGHVILPGSITASIPVGDGDTVTAMFAGLGSVTARFTEDR
jgi:2-keto-4-pentenoate hydratase